MMPADMPICGVDFSSAPSKSKPIRVALGHRSGHTLCIEEVLPFARLTDFGQWLQTTPRWYGAFDMPFGLSRTLIDVLGWPGAAPHAPPTPWVSLIQFYATLTREEIRTTFQAWCNAHPTGKKFAHRITDLPARSSPSMKWINPPVALMLHAGPPLLLDADATVPGLRQGNPNKIALEGYPGHLVAALQGEGTGRRKAYKHDTPEQQTAAKNAMRAQMVERLLQEGIGGWRVQIPAPLSAALLSDGKGDVLDAVLCALQAALVMDDATLSMPADMDPVEGWIAGVPYDDHPRAHFLRYGTAGFDAYREQVRADMAQALPAALRAKVLL